ncbi:phosphatidylserine decarboxylase [Columbia Basin potato purple top phytoplasma]|uniref:Phosphatidylserine decarboxylase n=1 Tax=Columbia Basin potato purple top phytoplasma TaxID=307134 RepID=A0ABT5L9Q1_9MOLU|nr:phosphatidylserine decarboxylase [Columbia Basin potato purple top phytoplasma]MDC9031936.1 phosphatidylserine decarboxylase [Columbia Basin potato purple top phytoplasma]
MPNKKEKNKNFLYSNLNKRFWKRVLLRICISKIFNLLFSLYLKSFFSKLHLKKVIKTNNINLELFNKQKFSSYNDFFIRKYKKISFCHDPSIFISPGEGKISVLPITKNNIYSIKGVNYHLSDLLKNNSLASSFLKGYFVILRLRPFDYHRYIFMDDGIQKKENIKKIKGKLHTVNPIAFKYFNVFHENSREYNILETKNFSTIIQIEVGALLVGKINNHPITSFQKGEEKGFFSFGGSTIILLIKKNKVIFDKIFIENSLKNIETKINIGDRLGYKMNI